jgi:hypothetical protein
MTSLTALDVVAPAFVEMAHRIVWAPAATIDRAGRPTTRVLHPIWEWTGSELVGWLRPGLRHRKELTFDAVRSSRLRTGTQPTTRAPRIATRRGTNHPS